ncbi:Protein kinase domain-containing protein [Hirschfeldia incana]|nr:Protein kinase domain-containing protein [Hirschfeldia incana]
MTCSLEFPDRISFRNFRVDGGEMNPYDLAISVDAWEAFKLKIHKYPFLESADTADAACSFTTNEGGGPSSSGGENLHRSIDPPANTLSPPLPSSTVSDASPIYSSRSVITSWLKGLGRGSFGFVYEGHFRILFLWIVMGTSLLSRKFHYLTREVMHKSAYNNSKSFNIRIVRYRGTAKNWSNFYIFLELVTQGSLLKLYQRNQLSNSVVSTYTRQILDGLKYLHGEGFIHRDIKCANVLVDASGAVKLADFGLAKVSKLNNIKSCWRDPFWMAPEVINPKRTDGYGSSADIWSLGCTVLEMLTRQFPYSNLENPFQALYRIGMGELSDIPDTLSLDARDFIIKCLKVNPDERPTVAELLTHPFVFSE